MVEKSDRHKHVNVMKETGQKSFKKKTWRGDEFTVNLYIFYYYLIN
jgi:hypothetical protein